jgi:hypothetical protein
VSNVPSPLDKILDVARLALETRRQDLLDRAHKIRSATDAYVEAVEQSLAADLARRLGVDGPPPRSPEEAAQTLRSLVGALPELAGTRERPERSDPVATPRPGEVTPRRSSMDSYEAGPEANALWNEFRAIDFENMPAHLFKVTTAELAARARVLQERGDNAELIPERVIKGLTAQAAKRGIKGIHGLARHHEGDWADLARRAAEERERLANGSPTLTRKLPIVATSAGAGDRPTKPKKSAEPIDDDAVEIENLPRLQALARSNPIVLVGGIVENKKLEWITKHYGFTPEWIETQNAVKTVQSLEGRILDGRVGAVVILEGLIGHKHFEPIAAATRQTGTPLTYGDTAGTASLKKGFGEIEEQLGRSNGA